MDMTKDSCKKSLIFFSAPIMLSLLTQQLYSICDSIIVGYFLGSDMLNAVGNAGTVVQVFTIISGGFEMGSEVIFSKYWGEKNYEGIRQGCKKIFLFSCIAAILLSAICITFQHAIFTAMNLPEELFPATEQYFSIYAGGLIVIFALYLSNAVILSLGDSKKVMYLSLLTSLSNVILDIIFIAVFHWGTAGAAIATILAQVIGLCVSLSCLSAHFAKFPKTTSHTAPSSTLKDILFISFPSMIQQFALTFGSVLLQSLINTFGTNIGSGYVVVNNLSSLGLVPAIGIAQSISMFSSMNYGAKQYERIKKGFLFATQFSLLYLLLLDILFLWKADFFITLFFPETQNPTGFAFACRYLRFSAFAFLITGVEYTSESTLRGLGHMKEFLISNFGNLFVRIGASYLLVGWLSEDTFWVGNMLGRIAATIISFLFVWKLFAGWKKNPS